MSRPFQVYLGYAGLGCFALGLVCALVAIGVPDWLNLSLKIDSSVAKVSGKDMVNTVNKAIKGLDNPKVGLWKICAGGECASYEKFGEDSCYVETLRAMMFMGFFLAVGATVFAGIQIFVKNDKMLAYIAGGLGALAGVFFLTGVIFFSDKKDKFAATLIKLAMSVISLGAIPEVDYGAAFVMAVFSFLLTVAGTVITPYRVYKYPLEDQPTTKTTTREL